MVRLRYVMVGVVALMTAVQAQPEFDDTPRQPGEWGFRPEMGRRVGTNPPGFCWRPQEDAQSYRLQAARDERFADVVYEAADIEYNVHCPPRVLPAGRMWWRVSYVDDTGQRSAWSRTREFTIPEDTTEFPLPTREELASRVPSAHPRLFLRPEDLPRLRELARGPLKAQYDALVAECEKILANPPSTKDYPRYPPGLNKPDPEWARIWRGVRGHVTRPVNGAATLAFTHLLGGPEKYGQAARKMLMAVAEWDPKGGTGYRYNDEGGMRYAYYFSRAYTFAYDLLTEAERAKCREVMTIRGEEMYDHLCPRHLWRPYSSHSNRAYHYLGEIGIAFLGEIPEAEQWMWFATNVFFNVYPVWCDDDGGWHEGTSYWDGYLNRVSWWLDIQRAAFSIDGYRKPFFSQVGYFPIYAAPPNVPRMAFADKTGRRTPTNLTPLMSVFAAQMGDPYWQDYVERHGGPEETGGYIGFIRGATPTPESRSIAELPDSRLFAGTGVAFLHTDLTDSDNDVQVSFKSSPFGSQSHGNEAQNTFILYAYGEPLLIRSGTRELHGSAHHTGWTWSTRSVNCITVNGQDQIPHTSAPVGRITNFWTSEEYDYVVGNANDAYPDGLVDKFIRHILFVKPDLVAVLDELQTPEPSTFQYWLHALERIRVGDQHDIEVVAGEAGAKINMLAPDGLTFAQTDQFDPPPQPAVIGNEYHLTAEAGTPARTQQFVTLIWPYRKGEEVAGRAELERTDAGYAIRAELPDGHAVLLWRTGPGDLAGHGLDTNADVACLRLNADGEPVDHFTAGGDRIAYENKALSP